MGKHAYLIMAHNEWDLLNKLLFAIDDARNDIFLHIDRTVKFHKETLYKPKKSVLYFTKRLNVQWGGDSQIKSELVLLKEAYGTGTYDYYHLISGVDLPVKSQEAIHNFFENNKGKNFIKIDKQATKGYALNRIRYYYIFQNLLGRKDGHLIGMLYRLNGLFLKCQSKLHIDRLKRCPKRIYKGANWFSITEDLVKIVLREEKFIKKYCYHSLCADEIFIQTIAMNSELKETVTDDYLRCIDWSRGNPYVWREEDVKYLLLQEKDLFARKFSYELDSNVVDKIIDCITRSGI